MGIIIPKFQEKYLEPQPVPLGLTSHEIVRRAIEFDRPRRIPYNLSEERCRVLAEAFLQNGCSLSG